MNALFLGRDGTVHDYVGGLADIAQRRVRFIGDAATRIGEDNLRILRFFRFTLLRPRRAARCRRSPRLHRGACRARHALARACSHGVAQADAGAPCGAGARRDGETGLIEMVLGGVPLLASLSNLIKLEASLSLPPIRRAGLPALGVRVTEDAERLRERLRLTNTEFERLVSVGDAWWRIRGGFERAGGSRAPLSAGPRWLSRSCDARLVARTRGRGRPAVAGALRRCLRAGARPSFR